jgi:hypothetical protein
MQPTIPPITQIWRHPPPRWRRVAFVLSVGAAGAGAVWDGVTAMSMGEVRLGVVWAVLGVLVFVGVAQVRI